MDSIALRMLVSIKVPLSVRTLPFIYNPVLLHT